jgi:glycosyltransferase involved in cell wall biosynthesis
MSKALNIGFVSTRFHGTDGVTLEAKKWAQVLEQAGHSCFWFAGKLDTPPEASLLWEKAFFDHPEVLALQEELFGRENGGSRALSDRIHAMREGMKDGLYQFVERFEIDLLIPQNILAIPMHLPLGLAMTELLAETRIPGIAHHHDFAWERERFARCVVPDLLRMAFPPVPGGAFRNVVINSHGQEQLARRTGQQSIVIPNVFDFENPPPAAATSAAEFRQALGIGANQTLILQPTRVVPRKGIEHAIELVRGLQLRGRDCVLLVSHEAGDEGFEYRDLLVERAAGAGVRCLFAGDRIGEQAEDGKQEGMKPFTLWDAYTHADFVTYPSLYEGFGNALLEALYFRKPLLVNRYPVYSRDIAPLGLRAAEMDGLVTGEVIDQVEQVLASPALAAEMTAHNYQLGLEHFSHCTLRDRLLALVEEVL